MGRKLLRPWNQPRTQEIADTKKTDGASARYADAAAGSPCAAANKGAARNMTRLPAAPTAQPETPADNNDDNTTTVTSDNSDDVVKSDTPADNTAKVLPQTGVESSAPVIGFAFVLLAALGGAAAYLFVVRKKLN